MLRNEIRPAPENVVAPAREKVVVALDVKVPSTIRVGPEIEKLELAPKDLVEVTLRLLKIAEPEPPFEKIVAPPNVVVLLPAARTPAPDKERLPVMV